MPADQTTTLNNLAADPDFLKLSDDEQKVILGKVRGGPSAPATPKFSLPAGVSMMGPSNQGRVPDSVIDMLRPLVSGAAGAGGAALGGPVGAVAGYGGADAILQHLKQKADNGMVASVVGMGPGGLASTLTNTAEQYGLGKIGDALVSKGMGAVKAFKNVDQPEIAKFLPTTSQALESGGYSKLASVSKAVEDMAVGAKNKALDRTAGAGFSQALQTAKDADLNAYINPQKGLRQINLNLPFTKGVPGTQLESQGFDSFAALDKVIGDPSKLQDTLSRATSLGTGDNLKKTLGGYKFMDVLNNATTHDVSGNVTRIDPAKIAEKWADPEIQDSLKLLYNSKQRADITQFFNNVANTQDKIGSGSYKKLWLMEGGIGLGTSLLTGSPIHGAEGAAGIYLGAQGAARLLMNPKVARIAVALAGGEPLGVSDQLAGRLIVRALQGSAVALINADGSKTPAVVGPDGISAAAAGQ